MVVVNHVDSLKHHLNHAAAPLLLALLENFGLFNAFAFEFQVLQLQTQTVGIELMFVDNEDGLALALPLTLFLFELLHLLKDGHKVVVIHLFHA